MSSQVKKRRLNWTLLTISKFAFPEHIIKSLAQCNISLILRALYKLLQFILTRTPQTLLLWSRITLVWRCSHVLLIPSWLLWSTTMATKQGTTNSMTLKTQTRYVLYNYLLQYRSMFGCYGRRWDLRGSWPLFVGLYNHNCHNLLHVFEYYFFKTLCETTTHFVLVLTKRKPEFQKSLHFFNFHNKVR